MLSLLLAGAACAALAPGPSDGPYYRTIAPFEHFSSARTQVFPQACGLRGPDPRPIARPATTARPTAP